MNRYLIGLTLLGLTACGGSEAAPKPQKSTTTEPAANESSSQAETKESTDNGSAQKTSGKQDWADSMGTATISGVVKFEGTPPERTMIKMDSDPKCHSADEGLLDETVIVNEGGLANVILSVSKGLDGYKFARGTGSVTLGQKGCQYVPHVLALQQGQSISIENNDDTTHNVHAFPKRNSAFNQAQPAGMAPLVKVMKQKEKLFPIKCDMHAWMSCQVAIFDHPFFVVSDGNGNFTLPKLPAGTYTVTAQHESLGTQKAEATVAEAGNMALTFAFKP